MADVLLFALNLAWKLLAVAFGWMLFRYVLKNGKGAFHDLLETLEIAISAGCKLVRRKLVQKLQKENKRKETETELNGSDGQVKAEETVV